jgi:thymidylate synthase ThyX
MSFIKNIGKGLENALDKMENFLGKPYFNKIKKEIDGLSKEEQEQFLEKIKKTLEKSSSLIWVFTFLPILYGLATGNRAMVAIACIFYFAHRYKVDIQKDQLRKLLIKINGEK